MESNKVLIRLILALALGILGVSVKAVPNNAFVQADVPTPTLNWVQVTTSHSPPARESFAMAYDSARGVVVLFGGQLYGGDFFNDTWEYDGTDWARVATENRPSARYGHGMAYDAWRGVVVLFGGWDGSSNLGDTWEYDGTNWTQRTPGVSPRTRAGHALVYDSIHSVIILFGGYYEPWLNDTWEWDGVAWTQRTPTTPGPHRSGFSLAYDSERRVVVLFGGNISGTHDDTWEYDGTTWAEKLPPTHPQPLQGYGTAYDEARQVTVLFGGLSAGGQDETWEYDGNNWGEASPANSPPARWNHEMVYDSLRNRMVVFGGINNHFVCFDDTWEYGNIIAVESATLTPPSPVKAETVEFEITFSEEMNTSVAPTVTIGMDAPYTDYTIPPKTGTDYTNGYLNSDTTKWYGTYTFTDTMDNGTYHISISGAEGSSRNRMQPDTSETFVLDTVAPDGSLSIDDDAVYANTTSVTLTPSATDATSGVAQMQISNDGVSYDPWESYASTKSWTLPSGEGLKTVYVKYRDNADNVSTPYSDTITLDTTVPTGSVSINDGATYATSLSVTLTLSADDETSGVSQMRFSNDNSNWSGWESYSTSKTWTLSTGDGTKTAYVQYKDNAGNTETYTDTITLDTAWPSSSVADLPTYQSTLSFLVSWSGSDTTSGIASYDVQVRSGVSWEDWQVNTIATSTAFAGEDGHTYYFQSRATDNAGNIESYPGSDGDTHTTVDVTPPGSSITNLSQIWASSSARMSALSSSTVQVAVEWEGNDDVSGVKWYDVQYKQGSAGTWTDWLTGTTQTSATFNAASGYTYYFQSRAEDNAGNWEDYPGGDGDAHLCVLYGDFDPNGRVDVADIMLVAAKWRMTDDNPDWDPRYDLDGDGIITVVDIMKVVAHWNESCAE